MARKGYVLPVPPIFLDDLGAIAQEDAQEVFPLLEQSMDSPIENEQDWLLEALFKLFGNLDQTGQDKGWKFTESWQYSTRKTTQQSARQILRLL